MKSLFIARVNLNFKEYTLFWSKITLGTHFVIFVNTCLSTFYFDFPIISPLMQVLALALIIRPNDFSASFMISLKEENEMETPFLLEMSTQWF